MNSIILEPLEGRGMRVRISDGKKWVGDKALGHGEDVVATLAGMMRGASRTVTHIIVRSGIGSFSASRGAYVIGTVLARLWKSELIITTDFIPDDPRAATPEQFRVTKKFDYVSQPHITYAA